MTKIKHDITDHHVEIQKKIMEEYLGKKAYREIFQMKKPKKLVKKNHGRLEMELN